MVKKFFLFCGIFLLLCNFAYPEPLTGSVEKEGYITDTHANRVIDNATGQAVDKAVVSIPAQGKTVVTNSEGYFHFSAPLGKQVILSVQKEGYKPFSLTVDQNSFDNPLTIGIEKQSSKEIVIDSDIYHLGDDNYSPLSANAGEFKVQSVGPSFTKSFLAKSVGPNEQVYLQIGSVIGVDTLMALKLRQNQMIKAYSAPVRIYFNGKKVGELNINGDGQEILIPTKCLVQNGQNKLKITTGVNLFQHDYTDYDDIELMGLFLEYR